MADVGAKRVGKHIGVAAVVLGPGGGESVPQSVKLPGGYGISAEAVFHKGFHYRAVRNLNSDIYLPGSGLGDFQYPLDHLAKTFSSVSEGLFSHNGTCLVDDADLMELGAPVNACEEFMANVFHDILRPP